MQTYQLTSGHKSNCFSVQSLPVTFGQTNRFGRLWSNRQRISPCSDDRCQFNVPRIRLLIKMLPRDKSGPTLHPIENPQRIYDKGMSTNTEISPQISLVNTMGFNKQLSLDHITLLNAMQLVNIVISKSQSNANVSTNSGSQSFARLLL